MYQDTGGVRSGCAYLAESGVKLHRAQEHKKRQHGPDPTIEYVLSVPGDEYSPGPLFSSPADAPRATPWSTAGAGTPDVADDTRRCACCGCRSRSLIDWSKVCTLRRGSEKCAQRGPPPSFQNFIENTDRQERSTAAAPYATLAVCYLYATLEMALRFGLTPGH